MDRNKINVGDKFGSLTVLEIYKSNYICRCSCGKKVIRTKYRLDQGGTCGHKDDTLMLGKTFGELTIIDFNIKTKKWICKCSCGNITEVETRYLNSGNTKSCGHTKYLSEINIKGKKFKENLVDKTYGKFKVLSYIEESGLWECKCSCGRIEHISTYNLNSGNKTECKKCNYLKKFGDISGERFGQLTALDYNLDTSKWICQCDCGNIIEVDKKNLNNGRISTCGHLKGKPREDLTGKVFNELTAIKYLGKGEYLFRCSCGKEKVISGAKVKLGDIKSCGHIKEINLVDQIFGELKVLSRDPNQPGKWLCKCSCGKTTSVATGGLTTGNYKSCGHLKEQKFIDLKDMQFGELRVIEYMGNQTWKCKCSCGNYAEVLGHNLRNGNTHSCGCKRIVFYRDTMLNRYGDTSSSKINNPREIWQINAISNRENLLKFLIEERNNSNSTLTLDYVANKLNIHRADLTYYFKKYNIPTNLYIDSVVSRYEEELIKIFSSGIQRDRKALGNGQEIDIYFTDKKLGIEFNGNFWHGETCKESKYHQNKTLLANSKGIRLIHIFEYEWNDCICKNKIVDMLQGIIYDNKNTVIYARNTIIKEIDGSETDSFLNKYHLQNTAKSSIKIGCYYNNELIGLMTFGKPRFNSEYEYELIRYCWKPYLRVVGGMEKIFSYFKTKYNPKSIITYVDISKFTGNSYLKIGFDLRENPITAPNYVWCKGSDIKTRYQTQKYKLVECGMGNVNQTEDEIMVSHGYYKIYNSGNIVLHWYKDK